MPCLLLMKDPGGSARVNGKTLEHTYLEHSGSSTPVLQIRTCKARKAGDGRPENGG